jgi:hypothetical protein
MEHHSYIDGLESQRPQLGGVLKQDPAVLRLYAGMGAT